jgi:hypothetical protein
MSRKIKYLNESLKKYELLKQEINFFVNGDYKMEQSRYVLSDEDLETIKDIRNLNKKLVDIYFKLHNESVGAFDMLTAHAVASFDILKEIRQKYEIEDPVRGEARNNC